MTFRKFATGAALAIAGLAAAVGIGLLANSISGDNVGLSAEPLSAGETLAPASAKKADDQSRSRRQRRNRNRGGDDKPADTVTVPPTSGTGGTATTFDDHGGSDDGSGSSGSGSSGSGSSGSGSTSGGSGSGDSSGSGSSGGSSHSGGSDDSGKVDD
ncbi:MAG: hypothetical protein ABWY65_05325 [Thermoleophilaceae bacterium]|jgi:hypothetical protein